DATGTKHTEIPMQGADMLSRLDEAVSALDQPTMDGVNTYFVSWAARQVGLKVALSGLGGDELFAGYSTFTDTPRLMHLETLSRFVPAAFRRVSTPLICNLLGKQNSPDAARKAGDAWRMPNAFPHPYFFTRLLFPPSELQRLTEPRFRKTTIAADGVTLEPTWLAWLERIADQSPNLNPSPPSPGANSAPTWPARFCETPTPSAWPARSKSAFRSSTRPSSNSCAP